MCGILGVVATTPVNQLLYDGLMVLQHRGQDAAGIATAEGDASRFKQINTEYAKAPEVTRSRMYLETMQQIYASTSKVMVDTKGQGNLLYLPLDKLMQATAALTGAASQSGVGSSAEMPAQIHATPTISNDIPPQVVDKNEARSREALRSRDREAR